MTSREVIRDIVQLQRTVSQINDEIPDAGITLTRTAIQAITTAGTTLVWQQRIRGQGITWTGASITIPTDGWYALDLNLRFSAALNNCSVSLTVNGTAGVKIYNLIGDVDRNTAAVSMLRYFARSDVIQIQVIPSANVNVNLVAEGSINESPILHIVQLTNQAEV